MIASGAMQRVAMVGTVVLSTFALTTVEPLAKSIYGLLGDTGFFCYVCVLSTYEVAAIKSWHSFGGTRPSHLLLSSIDCHSACSQNFPLGVCL